ncbi:MAG: c-type cytochrome biogenesis protein CcmI [Pseudomonadota bacterium]
MTALLAFSAGLTVAAVLLLIRPLIRPLAGIQNEQQVQLHLVRDRLLTQLNELDIETADRNLDPDAARDERRRLEAELAATLRDLEMSGHGSAATGIPRRQWLMVAITLGLLLPLLAGTLYFVNRTPLPPAETAGMPAMVLEMVERLEKRLVANPADPAGWARLGRSYAVLGRLDAAQAAYARAYKLAPKDPDILADYAWLLYSQDPSNTKGLVGRLYGELQRLQPNHPRVFWFRGFEAYQRKDFRSAVQYWERLLAQLEPGSEEAQHLARAIASAKERLGSK